MEKTLQLLPVRHLDGGETVRASSAREAQEEVGVQIGEDDIVFSSVIHRNEGDERVDFFMRVREWRGEPVNQELDKSDDLRWVDIQTRPENMIPYVRRAIQNHLEGIRFDEFGWRDHIS